MTLTTSTNAKAVKGGDMNAYDKIRSGLSMFATHDDRIYAKDALAELERELAAAVAERDRLRDSIDDPETGWRALYMALSARTDRAEARLAAIDAAPTVVLLSRSPDGIPRSTYFPCPHPSAHLAELDARDGWVIQELIARPAKDLT